METLFVTSGEDDRAGIVADEALGNAGLAKVLGHRSTLLQHSVRIQDLHGESVTVRPRLEAIDLDEHRLSQPWFRGGALLCIRSHDRENPNPNRNNEEAMICCFSLFGLRVSSYYSQIQ